MVEKSRKVVESLKANRQLLAATHIDVVAMDAMHYVQSCRENLMSSSGPAIRLDTATAGAAADSNLLAEDGVVYFEARHWPEALSGWEVVKQDKAASVHYALARPLEEESL
jgi:16S rRNA (guanine966-N2)-methyltransferase